MILQLLLMMNHFIKKAAVGVDIIYNPAGDYVYEAYQGTGKRLIMDLKMLLYQE